jgi:hypothetical protein
MFTIKIKSLLIVFFFLITLNVFAIHDNKPVGARSSAMGNASVALSDFWSAHNNQAGLAYYKNIAAGFYYEDNFLIKELGLKYAAVVLPTNSGVFGLTTSYFGYTQYNESKLGLAYSKSFGEKFSAGLQLDYLSTHIAENYGNKGAVTFELGIRAQLSKNLYLGAHVFNPVNIKIAEYNDERLPTIMRLGLSYNFSEKIIACVETEKDINYDPVLKAGMEYHIIKEIYLRAGISTNPTLNTFGFGVEFKKLKFDFASSIHQTLGYSPQISLIYNIK